MVFAAIGAGAQMLAPVLQPAHREAAAHRQPAEANRLGQENAFIAEAAADIGRDYADLSLIDPEALAEAIARDVRHLVGAVQGELVQPAIESRDDAAALDRRHALPRGRDFSRDADRRVDSLLEADIEEGFEKEVVAPFLVHERGAGLARREHIVNRGQFLEVEPHKRSDILGFGPRRRDAHRDQFADLTHLAGSQDRLIRGFEALHARNGADRTDALQVVGDEDAIPNGWGDVDRLDPGVGERATHERDVLHVRQPDVADILAAAAQETIVLLAKDRSADALGALVLGEGGRCFRDGRARPHKR